MHNQQQKQRYFCSCKSNDELRDVVELKRTGVALRMSAGPVWRNHPLLAELAAHLKTWLNNITFIMLTVHNHFETSVIPVFLLKA